MKEAGSGKLARWDVSIDCCEWPGISCDHGGLGRVIGLDLSFQEITGGEGLDDFTALFSLQYLERLDLFNNEFNTTIPAALGNLTNLSGRKYQQLFSLIHLSSFTILAIEIVQFKNIS
ncbi:Receptor-like protein 35 [Linum perenne]